MVLCVCTVTGIDTATQCICIFCCAHAMSGKFSKRLGNLSILRCADSTHNKADLLLNSIEHESPQLPHPTERASRANSEYPGWSSSNTSQAD
ncbi:MAG: hypothetical protein HC812_18735 [Leptolyngbya sp. RL_3_1]|nr:hypothetical protein [Leptolyngbya sp. RL_3_1]